MTKERLEEIKTLSLSWKERVAPEEYFAHPAMQAVDQLLAENARLKFLEENRIPRLNVLLEDAKAENARLTAHLEDAKATMEKVKNLRRAVNAQADDETLWALPIHRQPSIQEAYLAQSLRWLHRVIEDNDEDALASIINQSNGDI